MTKEQKATHKQALDRLNGLGANAAINFNALYLYAVGLHVVLEKIVDDLEVSDA